MAKRTKGGSFAVFLEAIQEKEEPQKTGHDQVEFLKKLPMPGRPVEIPTLVKETGLGYGMFFQILEQTIKDDLVVMHGSQGEEKVELTQSGSKLVEAYRENT